MAIRFGIIGSGYMGRTYAACLTRHVPDGRCWYHKPVAFFPARESSKPRDSVNTRSSLFFTWIAMPDPASAAVRNAGGRGNVK